MSSGQPSQGSPLFCFERAFLSVRLWRGSGTKHFVIASEAKQSETAVNMKFLGCVWQEEGKIRGRISLLKDPSGTEEKTAFFTSFEELKKFLEQEFARQQCANSQSEIQ